MPAFHKSKGASPLVPQTQPMPKNMERAYDPEEDNYILATKKVLTELETKPQTVVPCCVFDQIFKKDIGLQTHMNKHWRENVAQDNNFNI